MVDFIVGKELDERYGEFLMSELKVFDDDPYRVAFDDLPKAAKERFHVVVVGAGMSGILAAIRLGQAGIGYTVVEKNADVGGTWFENRYPGCRVDSPNHTYSYSFAPNDWPQHFSPQKVLLGYFDRIATEFDIRPNIRLRTEVVEARYAADGTWRVLVRGPAGDETLTANAIISAVGQLNRPKLPAIEGVGAFQGPAFHTAQWQSEHDLAGKRIVVIGTGASAFQTVPEIAQVAERVTVFQRTPPWVAPRAEYHDYITQRQTLAAEQRALLRQVVSLLDVLDHCGRAAGDGGARSGLERGRLDQRRQRSTARHADGQRRADGRRRSRAACQVRAAVSAGRQAHAGRQRPLVPGAQARQRGTGDGSDCPASTPAGVETQSGRQVDADVLIYGTGFYASRLLFPMRLYGKDGVELRERWGADPRAYLGIVMPGYPNLFCCYGPNTNIVVNGSIIFFSECEVRYIMGCLKLLMERGQAAMDCRDEVHDAYNERIDAGNLDMAWGSPNVSSWYKNEHGRVTQNWPFTLLEFWNQTQAPNPEDYTFA